MRNKLVMEGLCFVSNSILKKIVSTATDLFYTLPSKINNSPKTMHHIGWRSPPTGFFKLNTNGSARENPSGASVGGIIKDMSGSWISSYSRKFGHTHSMAAELWGLRDGLMLATNQNIKKIIVEVDALAVVNLFSYENVEFNSTHPYSAIIIDYRFFLQHFEEAQVKHIHHEANHCTDLLAKEEFNSPRNFIVRPTPS